MKIKVTIWMLFLVVGGLCAQVTENNNATICWDTSLSMIDRDLDKDFSVLEGFFKKNMNSEVQVLYFDVTIHEKNFTVQNGNWDELRQDLANQGYDGASIFSDFKDKIKHANVFVFTDGIRSASNEILTLPNKSYLVNSSTTADSKFLERTALLNRSRLIDFAAEANAQKKSAPEQALDKNAGLMKGTVYIDNKPAAQAKVSIKGISDSFITDNEGNFSIRAEVGDTLLITSRQSRTIKTIPIQMMTHTNVFMDANVVSLDEVIVVEEQQRQQKLINTGYGLKSQESLGYVVSTVEADEISEVEIKVGEALQGKVAGLNVQSKDLDGKGGLSKAEIRGRNTIHMNPYALVVIDGLPMKRTQRGVNSMTGQFGGDIHDLDFIDPANIAEVTVLKGLAATNIYGSEGANGVILITSKSSRGGSAKVEKVDQARLKNNVYDGDNDGMSKQNSAILKSLESTESLKDAYETYLGLREFNGKKTIFYLDAFSYFKNKDKGMAARVISNLWEKHPKNVELLKLVSMAFAEIGDYRNVIRVNDHSIDIVPGNVNAYLNRAIALKATGQYQEALDEFTALRNGEKYFSLNSSGIHKTLDREIKNLVFERRNVVNVDNLDPKYTNNLRYKVRLVFEWNHPGAEFELQFVNPEKRFFNWKHTSSDVKERIEDEIKKNYRVEEFEFYGAVEGKWVLNAKSLEDFSENENGPLAIKCTLYSDFGYPKQTQEEVLLYFTEKNEKKSIKTMIVK